MKNNDCLRRIRYILDLADSQVIAIFAMVDQIVTREQISNWLKRDEDPEFQECRDTDFASFLNGLIIDKRGRKESSPQPEPEQRLNNNIIFLKLKIAFDLKAEEILALLGSAGIFISKHELSAFFRRADHKHYRQCKDQVLRNFLRGLQLKYRGDSDESNSEEVAFSWGEAKPANLK